MDVVDLTQSLMRFKSTRSRPEELRACFAFMEDFLTRRGVGFRRFEQNGVPTLLVLRPDGTAPVLLMSHVDVVDAARPAYIFQDQLLRGLVANGQAGGRVLLAAGHGRGGVVEDDDHALGLVVRGVDQTGDAGVDEGRIAQNPYDALARGGLAPALVERDARPHAHARMERRHGRQAGQRVAADVARDIGVQLLEGRERRPVRTLGAQTRLALR